MQFDEVVRHVTPKIALFYHLYVQPCE